MINYIFGFFLVIGIIYSFFNGNINIINDTLIASGGDALEMVIKMIPLLCLWLGIMKIASSSGLLDHLSNAMSKVIYPLFPDLKRSSEAFGYIASNIVMNMLGLGNAATPFGLKAMSSMQEENINKEEASRSMITFLVINTASVTLIPTTVISFRMLNHSKSPTEIVIPSIIVTFLSCMFGLILDRIFYHIWIGRRDE